jgi:hypothetical protein
MAFEIFMCGHGSYTPDNGFVIVPKGTTVKFYSHFMKTVLKPDTEQLVSGQYAGEPHQVIEAYHNCPNMTLHPPDSNEHIAGKENARSMNPNKDNILVYFTDDDITLKEFFDNNKDILEDISRKFGGIDIKWACCRATKFKGSHRKLADEVGVNAIDRFNQGVFKLRYKKRGAKSEWKGGVKDIGTVRYRP